MNQDIGRVLNVALIGCGAGGQTLHRSGSAVIRFKNGIIGTVNGTIAGKSPIYDGCESFIDAMGKEKHVIQIVGTKGSAVIEAPDEPADVLFSRNLDNMALAVTQGRPPLVSGESAWRTVRVIQAMYESARQGGVPKYMD